MVVVEAILILGLAALVVWKGKDFISSFTKPLETVGDTVTDVAEQGGNVIAHVSDNSLSGLQSTLNFLNNSQNSGLNFMNSTQQNTISAMQGLNLPTPQQVGQQAANAVSGAVQTVKDWFKR